MEAKFEVKNPIVQILIVCLIIGAGGFIYFQKPELWESLISKGVVISQEKIVENSGDDIIVYLKPTIIRQLITANAPSSKISEINSLKIVKATGDPQGYFKSNREFWMSRKDRYIDVSLELSAGTQRFNAEADIVINRRDDWMVRSVELQP